MANLFDDIQPQTSETGASLFSDIRPETSPFVRGVKRTSGQMVGAAGTALEDLGIPALGVPMQDYAKEVTANNPAEIQSLGDIVDKPGAAIQEGVANAATQIPATLGAAWSGGKTGAALGGLVGGPVGAGIGGVAGGLVGGFAPNLMQEYAQARDIQKEQGLPEEKLSALGKSVAPAALEYAGDVLMAGKFMPGVGRMIGAGPLAEGAGLGARALHAGKEVAKGAAVEGLTETAQTPLEYYAAGADPLTAAVGEEALVSGALGAMGGGAIRGGSEFVSPTRAQPVQPPPLAGQANVPPTSAAPTGGSPTQPSWQAGLFDDIAAPAVDPGTAVVHQASGRQFTVDEVDPKTGSIALSHTDGKKTKTILVKQHELLAAFKPLEGEWLPKEQPVSTNVQTPAGLLESPVIEAQPIIPRVTGPLTAAIASTDPKAVAMQQMPQLPAPLADYNLKTAKAGEANAVPELPVAQSDSQVAQPVEVAQAAEAVQSDEAVPQVAVPGAVEAQPAPQAQAKAEAEVTPAWESTADEYADSRIRSDEYAAAYLEDAELYEGRKQELIQEWHTELENRARTDRISDKALDDFVARHGKNDLLRTFRGQTEAGIAGYQPSDVREAKGYVKPERTVYDKKPHELTWDEFRKQAFKHDSQVKSPAYWRKLKEEHKSYISHELTAGRKVPDEVLADYPSLAPLMPKEQLPPQASEPVQAQAQTDVALPAWVSPKYEAGFRRALKEERDMDKLVRRVSMLLHGRNGQLTGEQIKELRRLGGEKEEVQTGPLLVDYEAAARDRDTVSVSLAPESARTTRADRKVAEAPNVARRAVERGYFDTMLGLGDNAKTFNNVLEVSYLKGVKKAKAQRARLGGDPWYEEEFERDGSSWTWRLYREGFFVKEGKESSQYKAERAIEDAKISHKEKHGDYQEQQPQPAPEAVVAKAEHTVNTLESHRAAIRNLNQGNLSQQELSEAYESFDANREAITAELNAMKKPELLKLAGMSARPSDNKADLVRSAMSSLEHAYVPGDSVAYDPMKQGGFQAAVRKSIASATPESLKAYSDKIKARTAEYMERRAQMVNAVKDPQTLDDFKTFLQYRKESDFTPEQRVRYDELVADKALGERKAAQAKTAEVAGVKAETSTEIVETKHTKNGQDLFVVKLADRVERDVYTSLNAAAKQLGGYYSAFRGTGAVPGFQFKTRAAAEQFQTIARGESVDRTEQVAEKQAQKAEKRVLKLRELADALEAKTNESLNAERNTNTARRAHMASNADNAARKDVALAKTMRNLADAIDSGEAKHLELVRTKAQVDMLQAMVNSAKGEEIRATSDTYAAQENRKGEPATFETAQYAEFPTFVGYADQMNDTLKALDKPGSLKLRDKLMALRDRSAALSENGNGRVVVPNDLAEAIMEKVGDKAVPWHWRDEASNIKRLAALGITSPEKFRAALREFITYRSDKAKADRATELRRALAGNSKVGFDYFPTPDGVASDLVRKAGVKPGMRVLEPSAGDGQIAQAIRAAGVEPDVVELSSTLREILEAEKYNLVGSDFLEVTEGGYDAIVMNPPFGTNDDIKHVKHAYDLLANGGKVVAIMGEGAFSRTGKTETAFREWLDEVGATVEKLPEGTFTDKKLLNTTGANARVVEITKPAKQQPEAGVGDEETQAKKETPNLAARRKGAQNARTAEPVRSGSNEQGAKELDSNDFARQDQEYQQWKARAYSVTEQLPFGMTKEDFMADTSRVFRMEKAKLTLGGREYTEEVYGERKDGSITVDIFGRKDIKKGDYAAIPNAEKRAQRWEEEAARLKNVDPFNDLKVEVRGDNGGTMKVRAQYALQMVEEKISKAEQVMQCLIT